MKRHIIQFIVCPAKIEANLGYSGNLALLREIFAKGMVTI